VTADQSANQWQNLIEVELIKRVHDARPRRGEFEDDEPRARLENPVNLAKSGIEIVHVPDSERDDRSGHRRRLEWKAKRIRRDGGYPEACNLLSSGTQHGLREIRADDRSGKPFAAREHPAHIECACAKIEVPALRPTIYLKLADRLSSPCAIDVETEQVIQEVVTGRNFGENGSNVSAFFSAAFRCLFGGIISGVLHQWES
jgi:hypothetical protein